MFTSIEQETLQVTSAPTTRRPSKVGIELLGFNQHHQHGQHQFQHIIEKIKKGLFKHAPELCDEGVGGTYFMKDDTSEVVGVFKPADEEAHAVNNPKQGPTDHPRSRSPKKGLRVGEAVIKECAAYLLDTNHFAGVPATFLVKCHHWAFNTNEESEEPTISALVEPPTGKRLKTKIGSLQQYVDHDCASWDIGPSQFPATQVQKIGVLDIRVLNLDRHGGNILVKKGRDGLKLVPIDHGYCLPSTIEMEDLFFEWQHWPQAKLPFDEEIKKYVMHIDIEEDLNILKRLGLPKENRRVYQVMTTFLKKCVQAGLTLFDIGNMVCRTDLNTPSTLERIYNIAKKRPETKFFGCISRLLDDAIHDYSQRKQN